MGKFNSVDIQQKITQRVIDAIESGENLPWSCPWVKTDVDPIPKNYSTGAHYSGMNIVLLWMTASAMGCSNNLWLTFKQAKALGGTVRKGERSTSCIFYKPVEMKDKVRVDGMGDPLMVTIPCLKSFAVFNLDQIEGIEIPEQPKFEYSEDHAVMEIDRLGEVYCNNTGLVINNSGNRACYSPALDLIRLPLIFESADAYVSTKAHELGHATGHARRLDRFETGASFWSDKYREQYSAEEILADLVSVLICARLGVTSQTDQHVSYLAGWLKQLKSDKTFLFKAAAGANKAYDHFMNGGVDVDSLSEDHLKKAS